MKSYSETYNKKPINWFVELNKSLTYDEFIDLYELSKSWITCACGNQCSIIPRYDDGQPLDKELSELGVEFTLNIRRGNKVNALNTLAKIEIRSAILIKEI